jgi:hypothetical protein
MGQGDVLLYLIVRIGSQIGIVFLLILRQPRRTGSMWLAAALVSEIVMAFFEHFDHELFRLTGGLVSGHNMKHVMAGVALAFVFWWLRGGEIKQAERAPTGAATAVGASRLEPDCRERANR